MVNVRKEYTVGRILKGTSSSIVLLSYIHPSSISKPCLKDLVLLSMSIPIQMIHIDYSGKLLNLLDSDDRTPLYRVKVWLHSPQMEMVRTSSDEKASQYPANRSEVQPI